MVIPIGLNDLHGYIQMLDNILTNVIAMLIGNFLYDTTGTNISAAGTIYWQIKYTILHANSNIRPAVHFGIKIISLRYKTAPDYQFQISFILEMEAM